MRSSTEFVLGLLDRADSACITQEDFAGVHGPLLRRWQERGFIRSEPGSNPIPSCPHCEEGVPYRLGERLLCARCGSTVDPGALLLWSLAPDVFLRWLAEALHLRGGVRHIDQCLLQLGTYQDEDGTLECFYRSRGPLSDAGRARLSAYRNLLILYGLSPPAEREGASGRCVSLLELLDPDDPLAVRDLRPLLRAHGVVRFEPHSGALWVGDTLLGEVPLGSKEFFFLHCLAQRLDQFVPYADIKHEVVRAAGSGDETEEATFCHGLKRRIKKKWLAQIDRLLVTTNKGDGYRLRGYVEV